MSKKEIRKLVNRALTQALKDYDNSGFLDFIENHFEASADKHGVTVKIGLYGLNDVQPSAGDV